MSTTSPGTRTTGASATSTTTGASTTSTTIGASITGLNSTTSKSPVPLDENIIVVYVSFLLFVGKLNQFFYKSKNLKNAIFLKTKVDYQLVSS